MCTHTLACVSPLCVCVEGMQCAQNADGEFWVGGRMNRCWHFQGDRPHTILSAQNSSARDMATTEPAKAPRARWRRPPEPHTTIKELGLKSLSALLAALSAPGVKLSDGAAERLLRRLKALFDRIPPGSLFSDWSPPAAPPDAPVVLKAADIVADSERSASNAGVCLAFASAHPRWPRALADFRTPV